MDKLLTDLLGSGAESPTGDSKTAGAVGAAGTSGTAAATPTAGTAGKAGSASAKSSTPLDDATRTRLTDVRTHLTAYAAAKAGSATATPKSGDATGVAATPGAGTPSSTSATATAAPNAGSPQAAAAMPPATTATPTSASATGSSASSPAPAQPAGQVDEELARKSLTAARDTLSQLTQLPAAGQLTGEARTQVAQLISNFNELITTQVQWRASYAKVAVNLNALLGPDNTDAAAIGSASTAPAASPNTVATGSTAASSEAGAAGTSGTSVTGAAAQPGTTAGAVGTSGAATPQIDPAIRAKLVELRRNLVAFEKASGGAEK